MKTEGSELLHDSIWDFRTSPRLDCCSVEDDDDAQSSSHYSCCNAFESVFSDQLRDPSVVVDVRHVPDAAAGRVYVTDVAVVGSGPSALSLSSFLSGWWPYYDTEHAHPLRWLNERLLVDKEKSLLLQDLDWLSEGIEGRSGNPVSLLYDSLVRPGAEFNTEHPSSLRWQKEDASRVVPHVVFGSNGSPGGTWQTFESDQMSLSYANWLELPAYSWSQYREESGKSAGEHSRARCGDVSDYYERYTRELGLSPHFFNHCTITSVARRDMVEQVHHSTSVLAADGECNSPPVLRRRDSSDYVWELQGEHPKAGRFRFWSRRLVLACGTSIPKQLGITGEASKRDFDCVANVLDAVTASFVVHSVHELTARLRASDETTRRPILIVGGGLTGADAVAQLLALHVRVVHVFRDPRTILAKLSPQVYPDYAAVAALMAQRCSPDGVYTARPRTRVQAFSFDTKQHCLVAKLQDLQNGHVESVELALACVLIGYDADLSFLADKGLSLARHPQKAIDGKLNPLVVDPITGRCCSVPEMDELYAVGPLVGDNFVRFLVGGAMAVAADIVKRQQTE